MSLRENFFFKRAESYLLLAGLLVGLSEPAAAHPGNLDPHFGAGGTAELALSLHASANAPIRIDQLNRVIFGASSSSGDVLGAFNADGSLDTTFGVAGTAALNQFVVEIAIDSHNRIVVAQEDSSFLAKTSEVTRYLSDGTLDTSFGTGGSVVLSDPTLRYGAAALALDGGDNIFVAGNAQLKTGGPYMFVTKLQSSGVTDAGFGTGGIAAIDSGGSGLDNSVIGTVVVDAGGNVLVTGVSYGSTKLGLADIVRLTSDGKLDASFGGTGVVQFDANPGYLGMHASQTLGLAFDALGNVVVSGVTGSVSGNSSSFLTRYLPTGVIDPTFNHGVPMVVPIDSDVQGKAESVLIDGRNRIVVTGVTQNTGGFNHLFAVRFNDDGSPDTAFGSGSGYSVLADEVSPAGGRSAFAHGGDIVVFGNRSDSTAVIANELIGYDLPPILPPGGFFRRTPPAHAPSFRPAVQLP